MWGQTKVSSGTSGQVTSSWLLFQRHNIKLLNVGLLLYMCLGGLLFDSLGEFEEVDLVVKQQKVRKETTNKEINNLSELRLNTVKRMWNITNQLNILYESNWTLLVLDELVDFERQFVDTLARKSLRVEGEEDSSFEIGEVSVEGKSEEVESEGSESDEKGKDEDEEEKKKKQRQKSNGNNNNKQQQQELQVSSKGNSGRVRSIKKSLIHSLATITTIGLPTAKPQSSNAKLATVLYGAFGIPLLFISVSQTGKRLAHSSLTGMLLLRHYCFSVPIHYLCCSCNLFHCLRWMLWCCCCCCCCGSALCCLKPPKALSSSKLRNRQLQSQRARISSTKGDRYCDTTNQRLKLKLRSQQRQRLRQRRRSRHSPDGATRGNRAPLDGATRSVRSTPYVIKLASCDEQQQRLTCTDNNLVRISTNDNSIDTQQQPMLSNSTKYLKKSNTNHLSDSQPYKTPPEPEEVFEEDTSYAYNSSLFMTSLSLLAIYLAIGAYVQVYTRHKSLVDAIYETYALLTTTKLPESFGKLDGSRWNWKEPKTGDFFSLYSSLSSAETVKKEHQHLQLSSVSGSGSFFGFSLSDNDKELIWDTIYLICGLNLVSMCGHFARLWISGDFDEQLSSCGSRSNSLSSDSQSNNNHLIQGSFSNNFNNQQQVVVQGGGSGGGIAIEATTAPSTTEHYVMQPMQLEQQQQQQVEQNEQSPINLAELYVISSQHTSPADFAQQAAAIQQQQQQTSDVSFGSTQTTDRSTTERASLCPHHQATLSNCAPGAIYDPSVLYGTLQKQRQQQHVQMQSLPAGQRQQLLHNHGHSHLQLDYNQQQMLDDGEEDEVDVDRMLKSCLLDNNKMRSSSSLLHLSQQPPLKNTTSQANHHLVALSDAAGAPNVAGFRIPQFINIDDSSLTTPNVNGHLMNGFNAELQADNNSITIGDTNSNNTMSSSSNSGTALKRLIRPQVNNNGTNNGNTTTIGFILNSNNSTPVER